MSDTPRTDAVIGKQMQDRPEWVDADFARQLEREVTRLRREMREAEREFDREARDIAAEERWKATQGEEYGSY